MVSMLKKLTLFTMALFLIAGVMGCSTATPEPTAAPTEKPTEKATEPPAEPESTYKQAPMLDGMD